MLTKEHVQRVQREIAMDRLLNKHTRFARRYKDLREAVNNHRFIRGKSVELKEWYGRKPIETESLRVFRGYQSETIHIMIRSDE